MRRQTTLLLAIGLGLVLLVGVAFGYEWWFSAGPGSGHPYVVRIVRDGRMLKSFKLPELEGLGMKTVTMQGQPESGPTLLSVLRSAGVSSFSTVTVLGAGARDGGRIELARSAIDDRVLLDIAKRGTTKVCGPDIQWSQRVRDVLDIEVR
jgi:hypothetical protein